MADHEDEAIQAIRSNFPGNRPDRRPIHAPGIGATGWFRASTLAAGYSSAEHFSGRRIPVTVRFSNGTGNPREADTKPRTVRGMAVRLHLGRHARSEEGVITSERATDLVSMTIPVFFANTVDAFLRLSRVATRGPEPELEPGPAACRSIQIRVKRLLEQLKLLEYDPTVKATDRALLAFADEYHPARLGMAATFLLGVPESYATCCYHAVHAFRLTGERGTTSVRFHWEPVAGVRPAPDGVKEHFLHDELARRLRQGPAEFVLRAQVAEAGDDTSDPTVPWPQSRKRLVMGELSVDTLVVDQAAGCERLEFDPTRLVPGVEPSDDEILHARRDVYARSFARRREAAQQAGSGR